MLVSLVSKVHVTEFILFTLFFDDISQICTTGRAICSPILVQLARNLQKMFLGDVSATSTNIYFV